MQLISLLLSIVVFFATPSAEYLALKQQAEAAYQEKSFSRSRTLYEQAAKLDLGSDEKRWVAFRIADTTWRADAANPANDATARENAQRALEALIAESRDNHDRVFAEANESLGDYFAMHPQQRNPYNARQYWSAALDWWAGSDELPVARRRYLDLVWKFAQGRYGRGAYEDPSQVPRDFIVNALAIADNPQDRAHARFILAAQLLLEGNPASVERGLEHLEQIVREGRGTEYYDDALFVLASRYANEGVYVVGPDGRIVSQHDYVKALELFRLLLSELKEGESRHREAAQQAIRGIISTSIDISTESTFLPDSEQELVLSARNVKQVELAIVPVDLTRDVIQDNSGWTGGVRGTASKAIRRWTHKTADKGDYAPVIDRIHVEPKLPPGAYDVVATSGSHTEHQLLLITDAHVLIHAAGGKLHVFVSNVLTGEPLPKANVRAWWRSEKNAIVTRDATADANGLAMIETPSNIQSEAFVTATAGLARQAYHAQWVPQHYEQESQWRIYAFTDRPAYRPDETVRWKMIARTRGNDRWSTPANAALDYVINDSRGQKVAGGRAQLNEFGSFWSELPLTAQMPLGVYTIQFTSADKRHVGGAQLFRLEEYKLPEFRVDVSTPAGKRYRLGDTIEATIDASYYFGGPVANATVEVVVHESPYYRHWMPWREYDWYFPEDERQSMYRHRGDSTIKTETLRTDENGRAIVRIDTPADAQEREYTIEARVVDASRREVRGSGSVRVLRNRYSVTVYPLHYIHRPNEKVEIRFKAMDANDKPVQTTGNIRVLRRRLDRHLTKDDEVTTGRVTTDAEGEATFTFTPNREGFFVIQWSSEDVAEGSATRVRDLVTAETSIWVTNANTTDLGWHGNDLQVIVDKESFRSGQSAPVMIVTPASGRTVLLSVSGDEMLSSQVLRLDGTVKLVQIPVDERHVPNFFITASSVFDRAVWTDTERIAVPPVEHFIDVDVKADREQYEPRQEGTVTITTRDVDGKPVAAEVAVAVADESVTAIQNELAGDPRQFFFGEVRGQAIQVGASVHSQRYTRLVEKDGRLLDDRIVAADEESEGRVRGEGVAAGGVEGGVMGGVAMDAMAVAPPPPPAMAPQAVSESVTVTASAPAVTRQLAKSATANEAAPQQIDVQVRSDFSSTAFWQPNVLTGPSGTATVKVKFPESLTTWRATARAVSTATQVGIGSTTTRTNLPLVVRLQAPRFFVVGDRATVSAVINNNTNAEVTVTPAIEVVGLTLADRNAAPVKIAANGEARVDWTVNAETHGNAKIRVTGRGATHGDAMERTYPVFEHGIDKLVARSGKLRGSEALVKLELPKERRATALSVQVAPSLAVAMLDALPYLIDFPYGCTEQTMSRFLPAAIVARTLAAHGLDAKRDRKELAKLDDVTRQSIARLFDMQHRDGGWGWWKEGDSDTFMTAYVVWGFSIAKEAGIPFDENRVASAVSWLDRNLVNREQQLHDQAWMLHAIAAWKRATKTASMSAAQRKAFDNVYEKREQLSAYSRALLALAAHDFGQAEQAQTLVRNLEDGVKVDRTPDQSVLIRGTSSTDETMATAYWGAAPRSFWWRWYEGPVETTSFVLQALVRIDPSHRLIEPAMNWLVKNRRGAQWSNTRDTAIAVLSLNDYLKASNELGSDVAYELSVNGRVIATKTITAADILRTPSMFPIEESLVREANEIRIRRTSGNGALYFSAEARFFSLEEPVKAAGNELFVRRDYHRLVPHATLLKGVVYEKVPLHDRESVISGERVEVVVTVETKNDYEYLIFEDLKPAGLEAVELQSGQPLYAYELREATVTKKLGAGEQPTVKRPTPQNDRTPRARWVHQELRDRKVALFIDKLPQGIWEIRYTMRAEVPGNFHALPLLGQAMYVPEIRANGDEVRVEVREQ